MAYLKDLLGFRDLSSDEIKGVAGGYDPPHGGRHPNADGNITVSPTQTGGIKVTGTTSLGTGTLSASGTLDSSGITNFDVDFNLDGNGISFDQNLNTNSTSGSYSYYDEYGDLWTFNYEHTENDDAITVTVTVDW